MVINFQQAKIVKKIFNWYLDGKSAIGIVKELKNKWSKRSIETMLENKKYTGSVKLLDSVDKENYYLLKNNQEPIISEETFKKYKKKRKREVTL